MSGICAGAEAKRTSAKPDISRSTRAARHLAACLAALLCLCIGCETFQNQPTADPQDKFAQARAKVSAGDYDGAATLLQEYVGANPTGKFETDAWLLLGDCRMQLKDYPAAEAAYTQAATKPRTKSIGARAKSGLGNALMCEGQPARATDAWEGAILMSEADVDLPATYFNLGTTYIHIGNWLMGRDRLGKLVKRFPSSSLTAEARDILSQPGDVYSVQLGAFATQAEADGMADGLKAKKVVGARVVHRDYGDKPWVVRAGAFVGQAAAANEAGRLRTISPDACVFP